MTTKTNPPQWYVDEVQALIPEARALHEQVRPVLDRYAQLWIEINKGEWATGQREDGSEVIDDAVYEHGMDELATWLGEIGNRFQQLGLEINPDWLDRYGVPRLTSDDEPWMP